MEHESSSTIFKSQKYLEGGQPSPTPIISSNTSNKNLEIAILFNIVQTSSNYVFGVITPLSPQGEGYELCQWPIV